MKNLFTRLFTPSPSLLGRFCRDQSGSYAILAAFIMPVLIGTAGLGTEYGMWVYKQHAMLSAADSGAVSAATAAYAQLQDTQIEAKAVTASYGYADGVNGTTVTVNQPPTSGAYSSNARAVEVIIQQPQARILSALFGSTPITISARAVAAPNPNPAACVLALDSGASGAVTLQGSASVTLTGCALDDNSNSSSALSAGGSLTAQSVNVVGGISRGTSNITTVDGINTGVSPTADPYANVAMPSFSGCDHTNFSANSTGTINPGVYCGGILANGTAQITMNPGVYIIDGGSLDVRAGAHLTGSGVTLVFTSSTGTSWPTASIQQNGGIDLTAPSSGPLAGILMFGDRNMSTNTPFTLTGQSAQFFSGALYLPKAALTFTGNSNTSAPCTQIIANTVTFTGNSNLKIKCSGSGTKSIGSPTAKLVE